MLELIWLCGKCITCNIAKLVIEAMECSLILNCVISNAIKKNYFSNIYLNKYTAWMAIMIFLFL